MTTKDRFQALLEKNEDGEASLAELGFVKAEEAEAEATRKGKEAGFDDGLAHSVEIIEVCQLGGGTFEQAKSMIENGVTPKEAAKSMQQHKANNSNQQVVSSQTTEMTDGKHPLIASAEKAAESAT